MIAAGLRKSARGLHAVLHTVHNTGAPKITLVKNAAKAFSTNVDSFLAASSSVYVEQMYTAWKKEPARYVWFHLLYLREFPLVALYGKTSLFYRARATCR